MAVGWSREEVEATVADYLDMLVSHLRGDSYNKTEHRRRLQPLLRGRPETAIEFKHGNISAVLIQLGFPYIPGYKPYWNYQALLQEVVAARLTEKWGILSPAVEQAERIVTAPTVDDILSTLVDAPSAARRRPSQVREGPRVALPRLPIDYLDLECRNAALGRAGEEYVIRFERERLAKVGHDHLADRVEHVARTQGDSLGFDVLSFEESGAERFIEVKTTKYGKEAPFYVSSNELRVSEDRAERYHLYRLFEFRNAPKLFALPGALSATCRLAPSQFRATVA